MHEDDICVRNSACVLEERELLTTRVELHGGGGGSFGDNMDMSCVTCALLQFPCLPVLCRVNNVGTSLSLIPLTEQNKSSQSASSH